MALFKRGKKGVLHLPEETAVYVPTTKRGQKRIKKSTKARRVNQVRGYLAKKFGGYTSVKATGGYILKRKGKGKGKLVREPVVKVTAFARKQDWTKHKKVVIRQVRHWGSKWGQESMGLEHEGDLYYIDSPKPKRKLIIVRKKK